MSRIIGDCLVAGGMADEPDVWTAETEACDNWARVLSETPVGKRAGTRQAFALRCKWSGYMARRSAECEVRRA